MFQTFSSSSHPADAAPRVKALRQLMAKQRLDAVLVPRADEHQGEYVPPSAERLKWLTGFSGSAGIAVVAKKHAAVFADGRYTVQVRAECDAELFEFPGLARARLAEWLAAKLPKGAAVGYDPWLHTAGEIERLAAALAPKGLKLKPLSRNLVDRVWGKDRPAPPATPIRPHPVALAGRGADEKIAFVQKKLEAAREDALVLTLPDSIAWTFNIRGSDVAHNPVTLAFAIVPVKGKAELYVDPAKLTPEARAHLSPVARLGKPGDLEDRLAALKAAGKRVRLDPETAASWFLRTLGVKAVSRGPDPTIALKAVKTGAEIEGAREAHIRDGAAVCRFLSWLDREAPGGEVDEIEAVEKLEACRAETNRLLEISFDTISGSGPNGAIVHYRVSDRTNRRLGPGELFLVDSGAQYQDGTTDITRTVAIGTPTHEMRERFTLVLKGHIGVATARFPKGTRGVDLDPLARRALWAAGLDYDHGTGHGVGSYLSVHEGPQSISRLGMVPLEPGMIISNEPGYYKEGHYGIRIENLVLVTPFEMTRDAERETAGLETLTLVPIDRRLVVKDMLTRDEVQWLDAYHARVRKVIGPLLGAETRAWLDAATAPL